MKDMKIEKSVPISIGFNIGSFSLVGRRIVLFIYQGRCINGFPPFHTLFLFKSYRCSDDTITGFVLNDKESNPIEIRTKVKKTSTGIGTKFARENIENGNWFYYFYKVYHEYGGNFQYNVEDSLFFFSTVNSVLLVGNEQCSKTPLDAKEKLKRFNKYITMFFVGL